LNEYAFKLRKRNLFQGARDRGVNSESFQGLFMKIHYEKVSSNPIPSSAIGRLTIARGKPAAAGRRSTGTARRRHGQAPRSFTKPALLSTPNKTESTETQPSFTRAHLGENISLRANRGLTARDGAARPRLDPNRARLARLGLDFAARLKERSAGRG